MTNNQNLPNPYQRRQARQKRIKLLMQLLGYPTGGLGITATITLLKAGQPVWAIITALASIGIIFLAIAAKFFSDLFNQILDKIEEKLEDKVEPLATWVVEGLEDYVVKSWWWLTSKFEGKYYQQLIYDCRDYKTYGLKTKGEFIFEFDKIFVPLRVCPESLEHISPEILRSQDSGKDATIWDFLVQSKDIYQFIKIAIIGAPGSGKTTLLKDLTLTYAQNRQRRQHPQAPKLLPILIYLRDVRDVITKKDSETNQYLVNSVGHFGFTVQKQIWLDCGGKIGKYDYKAYEKLGDRVGWRKNGNWLYYSDYTFNTNALQGHLPVLERGGVEFSSLLSRL
jgi:hypothetical protein